MRNAKVKTGQKAPDFTLVDTQGNQIQLSDFQGRQWVYLVFNRGFF